MNPSARGGRGKPAVAKKKRKTREELNIEGRERQRQKKRRGLAAGSRAQEGQPSAKRSARPANLDNRIGSKKPVPLIADGAVVPKATPPKAEVVVDKLSPAQELEMLENDTQLDLLLQKIEDQQDLTQAEQAYVDEMLDRIDELMTILGIELEDDEPEDEKQEDMLQLLKRGFDKDRF